jgi:hypothetical protein
MIAIVETGSKGVIIEMITAIGYSPEGRRLLQRIGFSEIPPPVPGKRAFRINIAESGAPLILQYREAFKENQIKSTRHPFKVEHEAMTQTTWATRTEK